MINLEMLFWNEDDLNKVMIARIHRQLVCYAYGQRGMLSGIFVQVIGHVITRRLLVYMHFTLGIHNNAWGHDT